MNIDYIVKLTYIQTVLFPFYGVLLDGNLGAIGRILQDNFIIFKGWWGK